MNSITFITGNLKKAEYLSRYLDFPVDHVKLDLDEIQSLDLREVVEHKVRQAYEIVKKPVIVEDVGLSFDAMGKLPGPFIKFFLEEMDFDSICRLLDGKERGAVASCVFGYFDGAKLELFEGSLRGEIAENAQGDGGYGFDSIFIPEGYTITRSQLNEKDDRITYLQIKPFDKLKAFLLSGQI